MSIDPSFSAPTIDPLARPDRSDVTATAARNTKFWGDDGLGFGDLLDTINPLQHIPVVSTVYRTLTGDDIAPGARVAGGALFGGPLGLLSSVFNAVVDNATGRDVSEHLVALLPGGDQLAPAETTAIAANDSNAGDLRQAALTPRPEGPPVTAVPASADAAPPVAAKATNMAALAALQRDLLATRRDTAPIAPATTNNGALAALREDLRDGASGTPQGNATSNIFAAVPPPPGAGDGPSRPDGRKPNEYTAAELASIYRAYQRAAEAAAPNGHQSTRVEE